MTTSKDQARADRIHRRINEYHIILTSIYEGLVDRDFNIVETDIKFLLMEFRLILKSIQEDDF